MPSRLPTQARAMWLVIVVAMAMTLATTELALGAIKNHWGEVSDRLYVLVFAAASGASLVISFFASEVVRDRLDGLRSKQKPD